MRHLFIVRLFNAIVDAVGGSPAPLTSPKLLELQAQYATAWAAMIGITDPMSKEAKDAKLALWKIDGEIKGEEAAILKAQNEAKIAEARNQRLQLNQTQLDSYAALLAERAKKSPDAAKVTELETAFNTAKEAVDNELLAKYAANKPAKVAKDGDSTDSTTDANKDAILELFLAGKSHKDIEAAGYARSTVWHVIDKYKKANGIK